MNPLMKTKTTGEYSQGEVDEIKNIIHNLEMKRDILSGLGGEIRRLTEKTCVEDTVFSYTSPWLEKFANCEMQSGSITNLIKELRKDIGE